MLTELTDKLSKYPPDLVLVYGDTDSTLAGAMAATNCNIPVAHVEAGLRSGDRSMPEERNRIMVDHISDYLLCPTITAFNNLARENLSNRAVITDDIMLDSINLFRDVAKKKSAIMTDLRLDKPGKPGKPDKPYLLLTLHRQQNVDDKETLASILTSIGKIEDYTVVFPIHPRTKRRVKEFKLEPLLLKDHIEVIDPVGYLDSLVLIENAAKILTDSGGMQKEAFILKTPCITLKPNTEWYETLKTRQNILVDTDSTAILRAVKDFNPPPTNATPYGKGEAAAKILAVLSEG